MAWTVRANEDESKDVDALKEILGIKTAAGALLHAAKILPGELKKNKDALIKIDELERELYDLKYKISSYKSIQETLFNSVE